MAQMAPESVVPVVELPPDEEFGDSAEIDPNAAASAAARIAEFISASEGALGAGTSKGGANVRLPERPMLELTVVKPGIPPAFDRNELAEVKAWEGFDQVNTSIEHALLSALDTLRGQHLDIENVSNHFVNFHRFALPIFLLTPFSLQRLK